MTARGPDVDAIFGALADGTRRDILTVLLDAHVSADSRTGDVSVGEMVTSLGLSQPTVSHHLGRLAAAGIVESDRRGRWTWYRVRPDALASLRAVLDPGPGPRRRPGSGC